MPSYTLELELLGTYVSDMPGFEILTDGTREGALYSISSSGTSISIIVSYGGALPSSLEFRFSDASGEPSRTVEIQSVKINDRYVNTSNFLSSDSIVKNATSTVDVAEAEFIFDISAEPAASEFTTGVTKTFTAGYDVHRDHTGTTDEVFDMLDGNDYALLGSGNDKVSGGLGNDNIRSGAGNDLIFGDDGDDRLLGQDGDDEIHGGDGVDAIQGGNGNDEIHGGIGNDRLNGQADDDLITGGDGADKITGGSGDDTLFGDAGDDQITAGSGTDTVDGGSGEDLIYGGLGDDQLNGGEDGDFLIGNAGVDIIHGDEGDDIIYLQTNDFEVGEEIYGGSGTDQLILANAMTIDFTTGIVTEVETLKGSDLDQDVTYSIEQALQFSTIDLQGGNDTSRVNISGDVDVTSLGTPTVTNVENGFVTGSTGNDTLTISGAQLDSLVFGAGAIDFAGGSDTLNLTSTSADLNSLSDVEIAGLEFVDASTAAAGVTIDLSVQVEGFTITGSANNDVITGGAGDDVISSGVGADILFGGVGADIINGGDNNDTFNLANGDFVTGESLFGDNGNDNITLTSPTAVDLSVGTITNIENLIGSSGNDDVTYTVDQALAFSTINLGGGTDNSRVQISGTVDVTALGTPTVSNAENGFVTGTAGADDLTITGAQLDALVFGAGTIDFAGGSDTLNLTTTSAQLNALGATDGSIVELETIDLSAMTTIVTVELSGQLEAFTVLVGAISGTITTGAGDDTITGGVSNDDLSGGAGSDIIAGGDGSDDIYGGAGADNINGGSGNDNIYGGGTEFLGDTIDGGADLNNIRLESDSTFDSTVSITNITRIVFSDGGAWEINVTSGDSVDFTGLSATGISVLRGDVGAEAISGTDVNDTIFGGAGADILNGGIGDDTINGEDGDDTLIGGLGTNTINGGNDIDVVTYATATAAVTVSLAIGIAQNTIGAGTDTISNVENLTGSDFNDTLTGDTNNNTIDGGIGNDTIRGGLGVDVMLGGVGDDTLDGSDGDEVDTIDGGADTDTLTYSAAAGGVFVDLADTAAQDTQGAGVDTISNVENLTGSGFNDALDGDADNNTILGLDGDDEIEGHGGNDTLNGGNGTDVLTYESAGGGVTVDLSNAGAQSTVSAGTDTLSNFENLTGSLFGDDLTGDGNANIISGLDGADTINGGGGADTILGGDGNDILTGGAGDDTIYGATIIGQSGLETVLQDDEDEWHSVTFAATIINPVIKMTVLTNDDGDPYTVRVRSVTDAGFEYQIDEWDYLDGVRGVDETVSWLAIAEGTHTLDNGLVVQAGTTTATNEAFNTVNFNAAFASAPVVMTQVMSDNDSAAVGNMNRNRTASSFQFQMLEEEIADGIHATETVGWIAIDNGGSVGSGFLVGETPNNVTHTVSTVTFPTAFANTPVVIHDMQTRDGGDTAVMGGDGITTSDFSFHVAEEQSRDTEITHTTEVVGYYALNEGLLTSENGGDNIISGGAGLDTLYGGDGADTFIFEAASAFVDRDILADFSAGEGDVLDFSDIITGFSGTITDYVFFDDGSGTDTIVQIDANGLTGGVSFSDVAEIRGITGLDEATLFANGNIEVI